MEPDCASLRSPLVHAPRTGTLWKSERMEAGCAACLFTVAVVNGQPTGNIIFIKRAVTSGFYPNGEPFLAESSLAHPPN